MKPQLSNTISWITASIAAIIMLQTLFFKFSAAKESVYIFSTLGVEPWGRIGSGVVELIASILLFIPQLRWLGALTGIGTMLGAILSHVFVLGIAIENDGGLLFAYALLVFVCCLSALWIEKEHFLEKFKSSTKLQSE